MSTVISVENLGKKYTISHQQRGDNSSLREVITNSVTSFGSKLIRSFRSNLNPHKLSEVEACPRPLAPAVEDFWALKDVSFEVKQGDRIGVIGRNGAGKSTLLKILSRITEPTTGRVRIKGRVASLLEVGTGFHPELTGRENIYLNGAILGMGKQEISRKFDEIVAFAEIEKFLDTPVKRYSSGMYVRLAFAVAAHLEPEILVVDEVLAVGDAQFQKKCLGKMEDVSAKEGRTVLFVSHNMNAVENLCSSALLIEDGKLLFYSNNVKQVIENYITYSTDKHISSIWLNSGNKYENEYFKPLLFSATNESGMPFTMPTKNDSDIVINIKGLSSIANPALLVGYAVFTIDGILLYWSYHTDSCHTENNFLKPGINNFKSKIPKRFLNEGNYIIKLICSIHFKQWILEPYNDTPNITLSIQGGLSDSPYWIQKRPGVIAPAFDWSVTQGEA